MDKFLLQKEDSKRRVNKANHEGEQQGSPYPVNVAPTILHSKVVPKVKGYKYKQRIAVMAKINDCQAVYG